MKANGVIPAAGRLTRGSGGPARVRASLRVPAAMGLCGSLLLAIVAAASSDPDTRPDTRTADCTAGGCHASIIKFRFLHAPAAVGACDACHLYADETRHTFELKHTGAQMCDFCHIGKSAFTTRDAWAGVQVHEPVRDGDCAACHDPHGSRVRNLINAESVGAMCLSCHDGVDAHAYAHTPVAQGECTSCHLPHSSLHAGLLRAPQRDLCISCHADADPAAIHVTRRFPGPWPTPMQRFAALAGQNAQPENRSVIHEPMFGECGECHDHHGSSHAGILLDDPVSLCTSCHEEVAWTIAEASVPHSAVENDRACLNCHAPHHSAVAGLLRGRPIDMCMDCHASPATRADGSMVPALIQARQPGAHLHGSIAQEGRCSGCHTVHGGARPALLAAAYSTELYQSYSAGSYALCFTCHDPELATLERTTTATGFRDADVNLHYLHVSAQGGSGRSCRLCHSEHAAPQPKLLRGSVPYGGWTLPTTFTVTANGGRCGAGCHREHEYRRD